MIMPCNLKPIFYVQDLQIAQVAFHGHIGQARNTRNSRMLDIKSFIVI